MIMLILKIVALFRVKELIWVVFLFFRNPQLLYQATATFSVLTKKSFKLNHLSVETQTWAWIGPPPLSHIPAAAFFISATLTVTKGLHQWTSCMMVQV